jgi:[ribosomal protein S18]-alanine N-acetyltransferase
VRIRQATAADIPAMIVLERRSSATSHWSNSQYEALLTGANYGPYSSSYVLVVEEKSEAVGVSGFLAARKVDAEWELENIAVAENVRRKGIASRLLGELISHARESGGTAIFLEVRESNGGARSLYRRLGFQENGVRKNYYSNPAENAVLYRLSLEITTFSQ